MHVVWHYDVATNSNAISCAFEQNIENASCTSDRARNLCLSYVL